MLCGLALPSCVGCKPSIQKTQGGSRSYAGRLCVSFRRNKHEDAAPHAIRHSALGLGPERTIASEGSIRGKELLYLPSQAIEVAERRRKEGVRVRGAPVGDGSTIPRTRAGPLAAQQVSSIVAGLKKK